MPKLVIIFLTLVCLSPLTALTSHNQSAPLTLDTANPRLTLLNPLGGEIWAGGQIYGIAWSGEETNPIAFPVTIYYSRDGGITWSEEADSLELTGLYDWMLPALATYNARIRIRATDLFGNPGLNESGDFICLALQVPSSPQNVHLQLVNGTDILISWDAVTTDLEGNPCLPDGYLILYSPELVPAELFTTLATVESNQFLHLDAVSGGNRLFYIVKAIINEP